MMKIIHDFATIRLYNKFFVFGNQLKNKTIHMRT